MSAEFELETIDFVQVEGIIIKDLDVEEPFLQIIRADERDSWWERAINLGEFFAQAFRCKSHGWA